MTAYNVIVTLFCLLVGLWALSLMQPLFTPGRQWVMLAGILAIAVFIGAFIPLERAEWPALAWAAGVMLFPFGKWAGHYVDRLRVILAERKRNDGTTIETIRSEGAGSPCDNGRGPCTCGEGTEPADTNDERPVRDDRPGTAERRRARTYDADR